MKNFVIIILVVFLFFGKALAQYYESLTKTASNTEYGGAENIVISPGPLGIIYVASGNGGLHAFNRFYDCIGHIDDTEGYARDLALSPDGTIFLANGQDGLRAYSFDGTSFTGAGHISDGGNVYSVAVGPKKTIFTANSSDGLWAYNYDGAAFTNTAHFDTLGNVYGVDVDVLRRVFTATSNGIYMYQYAYNQFKFIERSSPAEMGDVVVRSIGTICAGSLNHGIGLFSYDSTGFTGHIASINPGGTAHTIAFSSTGNTIFLANYDDGLRAYAYDGDSLMERAQIIEEDYPVGVAVGLGQVISANRNGGIFGYEFENTYFSPVNNNNYAGIAFDVAAGPGNTIFLANGSGGLRAYNYDGSSLISIAEIDNGGTALGLAMASDSSIFLANGNKGLWAYRYDGEAFIEKGHIADTGRVIDIAIGHDNTIFAAKNDSGLWAYNFTGSSFNEIAHINEGGEASGVAVSPDSVIYLANCGKGLCAYQLKGSYFTSLASTTEWGPVIDVAVAEDGTIFTANASKGLFAFTFDGAAFEKTAEIRHTGYAYGVTVGPDGTVFLANGTGSVRAYQYTDGSFNSLAVGSYARDARKVAIASDGTILVANGNGGLITYEYSGYKDMAVENSSTPYEYYLSQNYPNPFNHITNIRYEVPAKTHINLSIYNLNGNLIETLVDIQQIAGSHKAVWNAYNFPSGIYIYRIKAGNFTDVKKCILIK